MTKQKPLYILIALFIVPMMISVLLYVFADTLHFHTINHGALLKPAKPIGTLFSSEKKWKIIVIDNGHCDLACKSVIHNMDQVRRALGKEESRAQVIAVSYTDEKMKLFAERLNVSVADLPKNAIYLLDPLNNAFMVYPANTDPMNILKDLKKVTEVSQIG